MLFFYVYLFAVTLLGTVKFGPFSIRVYATIVMIIYLLIGRQKSSISINRWYLKQYIIFLILMGFAQLMNGEIFEYQYFKKILAYYLVCIVTFMAIEYYVKSKLDLKRTLLLLTTVMLLNNITTILQYTGSNIGWIIGSLFGDIDSSLDYYNAHDSLLGVSNTPGILGNVVTNAAAIAIISPLSFCLLDKANSIFYKAFSLLNVLLALVACFMTQQRTAFALLLFCIFIYVLITYKRYILLMVLMFILLGLLGLSFDFNSADLGRLSDFSDEGRENLFDHAFDFISNHPLWGGPMTFQKQLGMSSHNVLLDSWIFSGVLGFIAMSILIFKTIYNALKVCARGLNPKCQDNYKVFCSVAVLNSMLFGFTHNASYLTGFVFIFIVLALMLKAEKLSNQI